MSRTLITISAGLSLPSATRSVADSLSNAVTAAVSARGEALSVRTIELRDYLNDLATAFSTGVSTTALDELKEATSQADGLIAITPVFKASYSGLFKMFFDLLDQDALNGMPTLIAATAGTPRHSLVTEHIMRPLFTYMRAVVVPTSVFVATEDFGGSEGQQLTERTTRAAGELASLMITTDSYAPGFGGATVEDHRRPRNAGVFPDEDVVPFTTLLEDYSGDPGR